MIITQTPLRVSLAGGGTDFKEFFSLHGGCVLSLAIDKYVYIIINKRYDDLIYLNYSKKEIVSDVDAIQHELIREAMKLTDVTCGVEITILADIPSERTGLGSSGTFTVGLLNALHTFKGHQVDSEVLAREATEVERVRANRPIGFQDQYSAAYGGLNLFEFRGEDEVKVTPLELEGQYLRGLLTNILLFETITARSSLEILQDLRSHIPKNLDLLCHIKELAYQIHRCIKSGDFDRWGSLLQENWDLKKRLAQGVSNEFIDELCETALQNGALGGKICGAGGGGFLMLYCPVERQDDLKKALKARPLPFDIEPGGSRVILNMRQGGKV